MNEASIFAILDAHHHIQGTGFLVADKLAVTCAHVVRSCGKGPGDDLDIHFLDVGETITIRVMPEYWHEDEDVAFLSLPQESSVKKAPLHLRAANRSIDAPIKSYGFPNTPTEGLYAQGKVLGLVKDGKARKLVQLNSTEITKGFSGAPIWDTQTYQVVGMVTAVLKADSLGRLDQVAFASPSETLVKLYPFLSLHDPAGDLVQGITRLPFGYDTRIKNFITDYLEAPFGGREADMAALDAWLTTPDAPPYALLAAEAGRGKSALLVKWIQTVQARNLAEIAFVPVSLRYNTAQATTIFTSLAVRLGVVYQEHTPYAQLSAEEWKSVCAKYLERTPPEGKPILVILDGLDEATDWQAGPDLFPVHPPEGVRVLVTARYQAGDVDARGWLNRLGWEKVGRVRTFPLDYLSENGVRDVLEKMGNPLDKLATQVDVIHELFRLSEGDPLLVRLYVEALLPYGDQAAQLQSEALSKLETGLGGFFDQWWIDQKKQWGKDNPLKVKYVSTTLNLLACALAPLSKTDFLALAPPESELSIWMLEEALEILRRFVVGDGTRVGYTFAHPLLGYYFYDKLNAERPKWEQYYLDYGKRTLENLNQSNKERLEVSPYPLQTYGAHLQRAKRPAQEFYVLVNEGWMRARFGADGSYSGFLTDVDRAWAISHSINEINSTAEEQTIALPIRFALMGTSVNSLSRNIPVELLVALLREKVWTPTQVLATIEQYSLEERMVASVEVMSYLDRLGEVALNDLLKILQTVSDPYTLERFLVPLAPFLNDQSLQTTFQIVETIDHLDILSKILLALASQINVDNLLLHALKLAEYETVLLLNLFPKLSISLQKQLLELHPEILPEILSARVLENTSTQEAVENALSAIATLQDDHRQAKLLQTIAPKLDGKLLWQAVELAFAIEDKSKSLETVARFLAKLDVTQKDKVCTKLAEVIGENVERAVAMLPYSEWINFTVLEKLFNIATKEATKKNYRIEILNKISPLLHQSLIQKAFNLLEHKIERDQQREELGLGAKPKEDIEQDDRYFVSLLIGLAPSLKGDVLLHAFSLAQHIKGADDYYKLVAALIPRLDLAELRQALLRIEAYDGILDAPSDYEKARAYTAIAERWANYSLQESLSFVDNFPNPYHQCMALARIAFQQTDAHCRSNLIRMVIEKTEKQIKIEHYASRIEIVRVISPLLHERQLLEKTLAITQSIEDWQHCNETIQHLRNHLTNKSLDEVEEEEFEPTGTHGQMELAFSADWDELSYEEVSREIPVLDALSIPQTGKELLDVLFDLDNQYPLDDDLQGRLCEVLSPHLSPQIIEQALQSAKRFRNEYKLWCAFRLLVPFIPAQFIPDMFERAKRIKNSKYRNWTFRSLSPYVSKELLLEMFALANNGWEDHVLRLHIVGYMDSEMTNNFVGNLGKGSKHFWNNWSTLNAIASTLNQDSLAQAITYILAHPSPAKDFQRLLDAVAQYLDHELLEKAFRTLKEWTEYNSYAYSCGIRSLSPYFHQPLVIEALTETFNLPRGFTGDRTNELVAFAANSQLQPTAELRIVIENGLYTLAKEQPTRAEFLKDISALAPMIYLLDGKKGVVETIEAIEEVSRWWP